MLYMPYIGIFGAKLINLKFLSCKIELKKVAQYNVPK